MMAGAFPAGFKEHALCTLIPVFAKQKIRAGEKWQGRSMATHPKDARRAFLPPPQLQSTDAISNQAKED